MSKTIRGKLTENMPLSRYTTWRVGGNAKQFFQPKDVADLALFLSTLPEGENLFWLGLGSNLLIRDGGFEGTVISTLTGMQDLSLLDDCIVRAEAGVSCAKLARFCARQGLVGGEFWAGIPGSVGGALAMNAGCFDGETWNFVEAVETISRQGEIKLRKANDYQIGYRSVTGPENEWFIAGYFRLKHGDKEESLEKIRKLLDHRAATQPTGDHNCGSVFRNPEGDFAGRLIETTGLKGTRIGGACVSEKHANFIINENNAKAQDIEQLIQYVADKVKEEHGVELYREVKIIGQPL